MLKRYPPVLLAISTKWCTIVTPVIPFSFTPNLVSFKIKMHNLVSEQPFLLHSFGRRWRNCIQEQICMGPQEDLALSPINTKTVAAGANLWNPVWMKICIGNGYDIAKHTLPLSSLDCSICQQCYQALLSPESWEGKDRRTQHRNADRTHVSCNEDVGEVQERFGPSHH